MLNAVLTWTLSWVDGDGNTVKPPAKSVACPYLVSNAGEIPVPAATPQGTEIDMPFTGIGAAATCVYVENLTGQELGMAWGGNFMPNIPAGGALLFAHPRAVGAGPIVALRFFLTRVQAAPGTINFLVFGT